MNWQTILADILGIAPDIIAVIEAILSITEPTQQATVAKAFAAHVAAQKL